MAGLERQGPEAATAALFRGKPCILTPTPRTCPRAVEQLEAMWTSLGMTLSRLSPQEHDRQAAFVSHLPHLASVLLVQTAAELEGWEMASNGFRDTTRLASSNPGMRSDVLEWNRAAVLDAVRHFRGRLDQLEAVLREAEGGSISATPRAPIESLLEASKARRDQWLGPATEQE